LLIASLKALNGEFSPHSFLPDGVDRSRKGEEADD
jgi:hypothetical protein